MKNFIISIIALFVFTSGTVAFQAPANGSSSGNFGREIPSLVLDEKERNTIKALNEESSLKEKEVNSAWSAVRAVASPIKAEAAIAAVSAVQLAESSFRESSFRREYYITTLKLKRKCEECVLAEDGLSLIIPKKEDKK